ncbi:hypothetical protein J4220_04090 [Candidatus Micrarchaeota archaeon]|nr:hypothetical protein [Candidatus Micrarchaeota archaeon]
MLYVSTSRKPTQQTRILAKWLSRLFGGEYENRGKRSVAEIAARMREKGFARAVFVYEKHGNPHSLNFLDAEEGWLYPEVLISGFDVPRNDGQRLGVVGSASAEDENGRKMLKLIGFERNWSEGLKMVLSSKEISFIGQSGKSVFSIRIKGFNEGGPVES